MVPGICGGTWADASGVIAGKKLADDKVNKAINRFIASPFLFAYADGKTERFT